MSSRSPPRKPPTPESTPGERATMKVKKAVKSKKRPSQSLAWRLERLEKMKENYRIVEFMGLTLSGDAVKDSKHVLEKRNQLARLLMPKIYNPEEKHKRKYMRHMALINEAYSLVRLSFYIFFVYTHTHTPSSLTRTRDPQVLKNTESRRSFQSLMWLRNYYRHFVEYGRRRDHDNLAKLCKMAEKLLSEFRSMQFPIRPIQEVKLAHKILLGIIAFKDVLFVVEQSKRMTVDLNRQIQASITSSLERVSPRDTLGLHVARSGRDRTIQLCEIMEAAENVKFAQKVHLLDDTTGDAPDMCHAIADCAEALHEKGRWVSKWMFVVMAGGDFEGEKQKYDDMIKAMNERKHMALTIVGIVLDGSDSTLFNRLSTDFPSSQKGCGLRFCLLNDRNVEFSFNQALKLMRDED